MKTAIVTGATSYIGLSLINRLLSEGIEVHAIIRDQSNTKRLFERLNNQNINIYDGTQQSLINIFSKILPDTVFHLAGQYVRDEKPRDVEILVNSNILFGCQLISAILNSSVKYFINTSIPKDLYLKMHIKFMGTQINFCQIKKLLHKYQKNF